MKHINLYQAAFHPPKTPLPARKLLAGGAVFLCGLLAVYAWDAWRLAQLRQEVSQLTQRASQLEAQVNASNVVRQVDPHMLLEAESVEARLRNLQWAQEALASGVLGSTTGYSAQFRALARASVPGAWLTRVEVAASGHELNLRGRALTGEDSAKLIASLRREPLFVGLSFAGLTLDPPEDKSKDAETTAAAGVVAAIPRFLEFTLSAHLKPVQPGTAPRAQRPDTAALAALAAQAAAGKLDVNQAMQAAAAGKEQ